jgi:hypothetical protein
MACRGITDCECARLTEACDQLGNNCWQFVRNCLYASTTPAEEHHLRCQFSCTGFFESVYNMVIDRRLVHKALVAGGAAAVAKAILGGGDDFVPPRRDPHQLPSSAFDVYFPAGAPPPPPHGDVHEAAAVMTEQKSEKAATAAADKPACVICLTEAPSVACLPCGHNACVRRVRRASGRWPTAPCAGPP